MMDDRENKAGGNAALAPEQVALLAEFGYDARFVRKLARREGGAQQLADMVTRARRGELSPRGAEPRPVAASRYGDAPTLAGWDVLLLWLVLLPSVLLLLVFFVGCIDLLAMTQGHRAYYDAHLVSTWAAVVMTVVPFAALDVLARWRGRRLLCAAPVWRAQELRQKPEELGNRRLPPVFPELAFVPILTLIPIVYLQHNVAHPGNGLLVVVAGVLVGAFGISLLLAGRPLYAAVLAAAWAVWAWLVLHGNSTLPTAALLVPTAALGVSYFLGQMKARPGHGPGTTLDTESAP